MPKNRIKLLSNLVANQIAAGEVVERPAAVLKELLENSIDAGARNITITASNGGISLIKIQDDGVGIVQEDLPLAFAQHATSKITALQDLDTITSLGFRGEALASIAAVSKLLIISKPEQQIYAYRAELQDTTGNCTVEPYSHPNGTTVSMQNLYHNVPARKKFLRSERTEFLYLEELFKSIALSNFTISFIFIYNQKSLYILKACADLTTQAKRVAQLCGQYFVQHSNYIKVAQNGIELSGWLGLPSHARAYADCQYFFINNRLIKDRVIINAIRKAYRPYIDNSRHAMYCLYLNISPDAIDVNVHPTKTEVRFREANLVFFFLLNAIETVFKETKAQPGKNPAINYAMYNNHTQHSNTNIANNNYLSNILCILDHKLIILQKVASLQLISIQKLRYTLSKLVLEQDLTTNNAITAVPFIIPQKITDYKLAGKISDLKEQLFVWGLECDLISQDTFIVRTYPKDLELTDNLVQLVADLIAMLTKRDSNSQSTNILSLIAKAVANNKECSSEQAGLLLQKINIFSGIDNLVIKYAVDLPIEELSKLIS